MRIDIIFDAVCPWCYIGKRRLEAALAARPHLQVTWRWRPFMLNPEMPPEGVEREAYLIKKFGSESRVRRVHGSINEAGQSVKIPFAFERIRKTPSTVNAHRLMRFADTTGKADNAVEALFLDYFINGRDIGDLDVLVRIGTNLGCDEKELRSYLASSADVSLIFEENADAHRLGINGVPSFVFNDHLVISGAQEPPVLARLLDAAQTTDKVAQA